MPTVLWNRVAHLLLSLLLLSGALAARAAAQQIALTSRGPRFLMTMSAQAAPEEVDARTSALLRRRVSLDGAQHTLGAVLRAVAAQSGIKFIYNPDVVPMERPVHLRADSITVAGALLEILFDTNLDVLLSGGRQVALVSRQPATPNETSTGAIVGRVTDTKTQTALAGATVLVQGTSQTATTGNDGRYRIVNVASGTYTVRARYIGYAPGTTSVTVGEGQEATADFGLEKSAQRLDEVVTTGTIVPTEVKALPTSISIITAEDIERQNIRRTDQLFRGQVPGVISFDPGPDDRFSAQVWSRGASSFDGISLMKVYIDGVEVADKNLVTIDPNTIERVEIIRGPQASTVYGAEALNGVIQVFTKKGQFGLARPEIAGKISAGGVGGVSGQSTAFQTDNSLSLIGGSERASYNLTGSLRHTGEWVPEFGSTDWGLMAGTTTTQGAFTLSASARYTARDLDQARRTFSFPSYPITPQYRALWVRAEGFGATVSYQATPAWQHTVTLGFDQAPNGYFQTQPRLRTPADTLLLVYTSRGSRLSLVYHTDLRLRVARAVSATITGGANYTSLDYDDYFTFNTPVTQGSLGGTVSADRGYAKDEGYFGQAELGLAERLFLTAGVRAEQNDYFGTDVGLVWSPRVGASYVLPVAGAVLKLRGAYGQSIRAPSFGEREASVTPYYIQLANPGLLPERQRGWEGGLDLSAGRTSLGITYYNQRAVDLIQSATLLAGTTQPTEQFQNVGVIKNEGWELEGRAGFGPVELAATYTTMNSTVQTLAPGYVGDLQVGDRLLVVPRSSAGAMLTYTPHSGTALTASMTYIGHVINSDLLALYGYYFGGQPYRGSGRAYWIEYPTVTKVSVGVSQQLTKTLGVFARADNVGNNLRGEAGDNITPMVPRSVTVGGNFRY